ncbi:MAG: S8 family serine peptidase [candidate division KSB1 bacterium]|nr:S8 family serine peptidase [candidate division KSB1 bacterium]
MRNTAGIRISVLFLLSLSATNGALPYGGERYWVFFRDKGPAHLAKQRLEEAQRELGARTLLRRSKVLPVGSLIDSTDYPVWSPYAEAVAALGARIVIDSRWLNAVSVEVDESQIPLIRSLPFVRKVQRVARWRRVVAREEVQTFRLAAQPAGLRYDYGPSYNQLAMLRVPELHAWGVYGGGILVGMLDSGYDWQEHEALQALRVLGEWDFIWNDAVTSDQNGQDYPGQANHGTQTLSVIAAFRPGSLIGPAFAASFYLAKTERVADLQGQDFEQPIEEDYWVAGLEWLERNGVDIVSTSLGYSDWYTPADMDGNTAVVTIAADLAVKKGVFVAASAGNMGDRSWRIVTAPADGDSVVAVGAVRPDGLIARFSSQGPTADGRIKPDVVAQGVGVYAVAARTRSGYAYVQGTSFSCPLVAGVAALILSAHPDLDPIRLRDALRSTASRASSPDTLYGWGIVDAAEAALSIGPVFSNVPWARTLPDGRLEVRTFAVSRAGFLPGSLELHYRVQGGQERSIPMSPTDTVGQYRAVLGPIPFGTELRLWFAAVDRERGQLRFPRFFVDSFRYVMGEQEIPPPWRELPREFTLDPCYPNPFRAFTSVSVALEKPRAVSIEVFDVRGRLVSTLLSGRTLAAGRYRFEWHGLDQSSQRVGAGVYLIRVGVDGSTYWRKVTLLR